MKKSVLVLATLALVGASASAFADCNTDIKKIETRVSDVSNARAKEQAQRALTLAVEAADKGDEQTCRQLLAQARKTARVEQRG